MVEPNFLGVELAEYAQQSIKRYTEAADEFTQAYVATGSRIEKWIKQQAQKTICLDNIEIKSLLTTGRYGSVYQVHYQGKELVMKHVSRKKQFPAESFNERDVMLKLEHDNIVKLYATFFEQDAFFLMELCGLSTQFACVTFSNAALTSCIHQAALGLSYIHSKRIVHRDVKPGNFLICNMKGVKLCNFGSAIELQESKNYITTKQLQGTYMYMPIESLRDMKYSFQSDVHALACSIFYWDTKRNLVGSAGDNGDGSTYKPEHYIDALTKGRIKERIVENKVVPVENGTDYVREDITERAKRCKFAAMLRLMLMPYSERITVQDMLSSQTYSKLQNDLIGTGSLYVNLTQGDPDTKPVEPLVLSNTSVPTNLQYIGFYFDGFHPIHKPLTSKERELKLPVDPSKVKPVAKTSKKSSTSSSSLDSSENKKTLTAKHGRANKKVGYNEKSYKLERQRRKHQRILSDTSSSSSNSKPSNTAVVKTEMKKEKKLKRQAEKANSETKKKNKKRSRSKRLSSSSGSSLSGKYEEFKCPKPLCSKAFQSEINFNIHLRNCNSSAFTCTMCGMVYKRSEALTSHFNSIHLKKIFGSCNCGSDFLTKSKLLHHQKKCDIAKRNAEPTLNSLVE